MNDQAALSAATTAAGENVGQPFEPSPSGVISDVETLKAISDPVRLRILETMVTAADEAWTVKRLAKALGTNTTKLYQPSTSSRSATSSGSPARARRLGDHRDQLPHQRDVHPARPVPASRRRLTSGARFTTSSRSSSTRYVTRSNRGLASGMVKSGDDRSAASCSSRA